LGPVSHPNLYMAGSEMTEVLETTMGILQDYATALDFIDLVRFVSDKARVDEATAKASILRLNFEGRVGIDLDWSVHLVPVECQDAQLVSQVAAA
jgi:hypothetical protein